MPRQSIDGRVLSTEEEQNVRWTEHFLEKLNQSNSEKVFTNNLFSEEEEYLRTRNDTNKEKEVKIAIKPEEQQRLNTGIYTC